MGIKNYSPTSAGMRFRTGLTFEEITKDTKVSKILFLNFVLFVSFVVTTLSH